MKLSLLIFTLIFKFNYILILFIDKYSLKYFFNFYLFVFEYVVCVLLIIDLIYIFIVFYVLK